jgi:ABC-2 type transport system permease protein
MIPALGAEWIKVFHALTPRIVTAALLPGVVAVSAAMLATAGRDDTALAMKVEAFTAESGWEGLHVLAGVIVANGGLLASGIMLSWLFGREFVDRTMPGLFALPTPLVAVAAAKLALYLGWLVAVTVAIPLLLGATGLMLGYGMPDAAVLSGLGKVSLICLLTGLLALPTAWVATRTRGYLAPVGVVVGIIVAAQLAVITGAGAWFPFAAPGLWAGIAGTGADPAVGPVQLALVVPVGMGFAALCLHAWQRLRI